MAYYQNTLSFQAIAFYFTHPPTPALKGRGSSFLWSFAPNNGAKLHKNFCSPSAGRGWRWAFLRLHSNYI